MTENFFFIFGVEFWCSTPGVAPSKLITNSVTLSSSLPPSKGWKLVHELEYEGY
jgi:hypothetical protein